MFKSPVFGQGAQIREGTGVWSELIELLGTAQSCSELLRATQKVLMLLSETLTNTKEEPFCTLGIKTTQILSEIAGEI